MVQPPPVPPVPSRAIVELGESSIDVDGQHQVVRIHCHLLSTSSSQGGGWWWWWWWWYFSCDLFILLSPPFISSFRLSDPLIFLRRRRSFKPESLRWEDINYQGVTGKMYVAPMRDRRGWPLVLMKPRNECVEPKKMGVDNLRYFVYTVEASCRRADEIACERLSWFVDMPGYTLRNAPPLKISLETLQTMQNHFPERMGEAICYHAPRIFSFLWTAISPFIDPVTYKKVVFMNKGKKGEAMMAERFDMTQVETDQGGENDTKYDHDTYAILMIEEEYERDLELARIARDKGFEVPLVRARPPGYRTRAERGLPSWYIDPMEEEIKRLAGIGTTTTTTSPPPPPSRQQRKLAIATAYGISGNEEAEEDDDDDVEADVVPPKADMSSSYQARYENTFCTHCIAT